MALEPKQHAIPTLPCPGCGQRINVACTREQADEMSSPRCRDINQVFPELDCDTHERFISGYCPPCWDKLFS